MAEVVSTGVSHMCDNYITHLEPSRSQSYYNRPSCRTFTKLVQFNPQSLSLSVNCVPPTYALPILSGLSSINLLSVVIRSVALTLSLDNVISSTVINNMLNVQT